MPLTSGERAALRWLLAIAGLGAGVQLSRHWRHSADATPLAAEALTRQLVAVDSAQRANRVSGGGRKAPRTKSGRGRKTLAQSGMADTSTGDALRKRRTPRSATEQPTLVTVPVDVDRADSAALERLPRIGPALAARIIADRVSRGAFGSIEGLQRVRGIGPKLGDGLRAHVTFSGTPRPSTVQR